MATLLDPDAGRAASHRHMFDHLIVPFAAGAVDREAPINASGLATVDWDAREPLTVVALTAPLGATGLRVRAVLNPTNGPLALPPIDFAAYSDAGASLPLYRPRLVGTSVAIPFTIALTLARVARDGTETAVPAAQVATLMSARVIEGILGRMLYVVGAEKQRIRREARELAAMRRLASARDHALDNIGADLAVPRFADTLSWNGTELVTGVAREPDDQYRARLAIYRPFLQPTRGALLNRLNGVGLAAAPNAGLPAALGVARRFDVLESDNGFAVAIHLVAAGLPAQRTNFLDFVRRAHLAQPTAPMPADPYIVAIRVGEAAMRTRLAARFNWPGNASVAPMLAAALDRVGRCRLALGQASKWTVKRAQDDAGGSRLELGLGVTLTPPSAGDLNALATAVNNASRVPSADREAEAVLRSMVGVSAAADPEGRWLFEGCGIRTVHRLSTGQLYLSHFATHGMAITGNSAVAVGQPLPLEVRYHAPGDPGTNAVLAAGLAAAAVKWAALGEAPWTTLTDANAAVKWAQAKAVPRGSPAGLTLAAAGLPVVETPAPIVQRLAQLPTELVETIQLPVAFAQALLANPPQPAAADRLAKLTVLLREQGLASALPLVTNANEVLVVVGTIGLPEAGINLSDRRATGFRWYQVPIQGPGGHLTAVGQRTVFTPTGAGLTALIAIGYARRGLTDPYEFRIDLPPNALLTLRQYEYVMNLLDHVHPIGIEINTFALRKQHVDLDGDGVADPLKPSVANTFRVFRRRRHRGEVSITL